MSYFHILRQSKKIAGAILIGNIFFGGLALAQTPDQAHATDPAKAKAKAPAEAGSFPVGPGSLSGIWLNAEYKGSAKHPPRELTIRTSDGQPPPLLPAAAALLDKRLAEADKGDVFAGTTSACLPGGVPAMMFGALYPIQILETPGQVTFLFEEQNHFRIVRLGGTHPSDPDPSYMGDSIGHWEGDTLVVDTVGLNDKTTLDLVGTPHTEALHVVERYRRISPSKIEVRVTIDDPGAFSKTWETRGSYKLTEPGTHIQEYVCENNRNAPDAEGHMSFMPPAK
ncbi:MAG TPA: hypothetical protein VMU59_04785 [Caulobacteraceae bacterium]|nr:hypothetical protein [Caulobacteraceae bacterium]